MHRMKRNGERRDLPQRIVMDTVLPWLAVGLLLLGLLYVAAPALANWLLFYPSRAPLDDPPVLAGVPGEVVDQETSDGVLLRHWWYEASPNSPVLVLLHGNAGHLGHRAFLAQEFLHREVSVLLVGYRGYGASEGRAEEEGLYRDGESAVELVASLAPGTGPPVLLGRSLGGAVAAGVAARREVSGLILDSSFTSLEDIAREVYPFFPRFITARIQDRFRTLDVLEDIVAPVMVVHGVDDELIPFHMGETLFQAAPEPKEWLPIGEAGHNDLITVSGGEYFDAVADFVHRVTSRRDTPPDAPDASSFP